MSSITESSGYKLATGGLAIASELGGNILAHQALSYLMPQKTAAKVLASVAGFFLATEVGLVAKKSSVRFVNSLSKGIRSREESHAGE